MTILRKIPHAKTTLAKSLKFSNLPDKSPMLACAPLLINRVKARAMLGGVSTATMLRMEQAGRLKPIRLSGHPSSAVFYRIQDIEQLALGEVKAEVGGPRHV